MRKKLIGRGSQIFLEKCKHRHSEIPGNKKQMEGFPTRLLKMDLSMKF
jgi:hypothetical protein